MHLRYDEAPSNFAFWFTLRRYTEAARHRRQAAGGPRGNHAASARNDDDDDLFDTEVDSEAAEVAESKLGRSEIGHPLPGDATRRGFYLTLVEPARYYPPHHPTLFEPSSFKLIGIV